MVAPGLVSLVCEQRYHTEPCTWDLMLYGHSFKVPSFTIYFVPVKRRLMGHGSKSQGLGACAHVRCACLCLCLSRTRMLSWAALPAPPGDFHCPGPQQGPGCRWARAVCSVEGVGSGTSVGLHQPSGHP